MKTVSRRPILLSLSVRILIMMLQLLLWNRQDATDSGDRTGGTCRGPVVYDINILNGEGTTGLASTAQGIIEENLNKEQKIINIKETKNADNFNYSETEILIHTDKDGITDMANNIKDALGVGTVSESSDNPDNVDITVILGSDFTK